MWTWIKGILAAWWDRLVASDVGLIRFVSAVRVTIAVVLSFLVIDALSHLTTLPMVMIVMGIIESLFGSIAVRDPSPGKQRVTLLLTPIPAAVALTVGTVLAPWRTIGDAAFIIVIFAATYARRFGPRATALGMVAYISYFIGIFLHLPLAQLPYQFLALAIGAASAFVVRFVLLPDRPEQTLRHVLTSFYQRIGQILDEIDQAAASGGWDGASRRRMRRRVTQLNEAALAAEGQIEALDPDRLAPASRRSVLGSRLFELEIIIGWLAHEAVLALPPPEERPTLRRALDDVRRALSGIAGPPRQDRIQVGGAIADVLRNMVAALASMPGPESAAQAMQAEPGDSEKLSIQDTKEPALLPTTRAAIQVTLACILAIVPGEFLSPQRWYWAVITVFVMFTGTQSRGDVLAKGMQRAMGTLAGVAAGILVATAVSGQYIVSLCLIFACVFLAFYFLQAAYGLMVFWITILISLLYGLLGYFSPALLALRIEETAIGAIIGVLVAMFILPTSSRDTFGQAARSFLQAVSDFVGRVAQFDGTDLTDAARELDRCFHQLRTSAKPLISGLRGALAPNSARRWLRVCLACDTYARILAARVTRGQPTPGQVEAGRRLAARIRGNIGWLLTVLDGGRARLALSGQDDPGAFVISRGQYREHTNQAGESDALMHALAGMDEAIWLLARDFAGPEQPRT